MTKSYNNIEMGVLENCVREDLNKHAPRRMAVLHPLKVVITNLPEGTTEELQAANHPQDESMGTRKVPFTRELYHRPRRLSGRSPEEIQAAGHRR